MAFAGNSRSDMSGKCHGFSAIFENRDAKRELFEETEIKITELKPFETVIYYYTRYRVTLYSFKCELSIDIQPKLHAAQQYKWVSFTELSEYAFPSGHRQLIEMMKKSVNNMEMDN